MLLQKERFVQLQKLTHPRQQRLPQTMSTYLEGQPATPMIFSERLACLGMLFSTHVCCWVDVNPYTGDGHPTFNDVNPFLIHGLGWNDHPLFYGNNGSHVKPGTWAGATSHPWWHYMFVAGTYHPSFSHCCCVGGRSIIGVSQNYCDAPNPQIPNH